MLSLTNELEANECWGSINLINTLIHSLENVIDYLPFLFFLKCSFYKGCCPGSSWNYVTQQCERALFPFVL